MYEKYLNKLDFWIFDAYKMPDKYLALCRISYAIFNLFFLFHFNFAWISEYPDAFYHAKPGITFFFDDFPSVWVLYGLNIILAIFNFCLLFGYKTKWTSIFITLSLITAFSFVFAFGNTYHVILWIIFPAVMSFSNWGAAISLDALKKENKPAEYWPISLMSILIGFAFFTSGFAKFMGGWLNTENSASWQYFHIVRSKVGRHLYLSDFTASIQNPIFWEISDWLVVGLEIGILVAIFRPSIFRTFICFATFFHFVNVLMLNISFGIHIAIFMVFINWKNMKLIKNKQVDQLIDKLETFIHQQNLWTVSICIVIYLALFFILGKHSRVDGLVFIEYFVYPLGLVVSSSYLFHKIKGIFISKS